MIDNKENPADGIQAAWWEAEARERFPAADGFQWTPAEPAEPFEEPELGDSKSGRLALFEAFAFELREAYEKALGE